NVATRTRIVPRTRGVGFFMRSSENPCTTPRVGRALFWRGEPRSGSGRVAVRRQYGFAFGFHPGGGPGGGRVEARDVVPVRGGAPEGGTASGEAGATGTPVGAGAETEAASGVEADGAGGG